MLEKNRLAYLDLLRGFAILGILISNLPIIAEPPFSMVTHHDDLSRWVKLFSLFFVAGKFFLIFSFVFGYGFTILLASSERNGLDAKRIFFRRLFGLLFLGILHATLFFNGDILVTYSLLGVVLYSSRNMKDTKLFKIVGLFWFISFLCYGLLGIISHYSSMEDPNLTTRMIQDSLTGYSGNFFLAVKQRVKELSYTFPFILLFNWPSAFFMFLIGLYLGKKESLANPDLLFERFRGKWFWIIIVGIIGNGFFCLGQMKETSYLVSFLSTAMLAVGGVCFALVYCYVLFQFSNSDNFLLSNLREAMKKAGTMSLTNYLSHSILLSFIFNGWGLGLYGKLKPEIALLLVIPIYGFNLVFSSIWKKYFSLGPFEIVLRKFTYWK
ncbi:MAG TPA: DUF418 domain-containing protein [Leptospiraceae bacterium]|nr:DUF418 domain-containing protein [Leptospiraceae bacterium]HRG74524.1 DUF418 domain-containing protein [Leptospiraceae bacterium]